MKDLQNLLTQVSIINKKNDELFDATGGRFNMFGLLGVDYYENTHSSILAELLSPQGSHGLKYKFLQAFIETVKLKDFIKDFDIQGATVQTEVVVGNGRIDIFIDDNKNHAIIIENKIYAGDQWEQLKRYNAFLFKKYGVANYKIFYLTLNGSDPSEHSGGGVEYIPISFTIDIILWLEQCVNLSSRFPLVRETINQYINHLKKLTNQDMDTKNKEDIVKILSSSQENVQAAFAIFENVGALKDKLISNFFNPQLNKIADKLEIKVQSELKGRGKDQGFGFYVPNWNYFYIQFDFEADDRGLNYYYNLIDIQRKPLETTVKLLSPKFEKRSSNQVLPCGYSYVDRYKNWDSDAYSAILSGEMKKAIQRIVENLIEQAKDLEM